MGNPTPPLIFPTKKSGNKTRNIKEWKNNKESNL
jgi:hypothetical protein